MRPAKLLWATSVVRFPLGFLGGFLVFFSKSVCHRPQCFLPENPFFSLFLVIFVLLFVPFALEKELLSEFKFCQLFCDDTE